MTHDELLKRFDKIRTNVEAPHKPLVLLFALAKVQIGLPRWLAFRVVNEPLKELIERFGRATARYQAVDPFWRLKNDVGRFWEVSGPDASRLQDITPPSERELLDWDAKAGFTDEVYDTLKDNPLWLLEVADHVLGAHPMKASREEVFEAVRLNPNRTR